MSELMSKDQIVIAFETRGSSEKSWQKCSNYLYIPKTFWAGWATCYELKKTCNTILNYDTNRSLLFSEQICRKAFLNIKNNFGSCIFVMYFYTSLILLKRSAERKLNVISPDVE